MNGSDWRTLVRDAKKAGWTVKKTGGGHYRFDKPGRTPQFTSHTPSDHRALRNLKVRMRREDRRHP